MKKLFSFLLIVVLISCSKDPVIYILTATANPAEGGSVSPSSQQYDSGDVATVTANPSAEYVFQSWSGSASGSSPSTTVTMNSDKAVVANFVKKKYALTVNVEGEGSVTEKVIKAGVATDYNSGTVVELTAVPEGEWLFVEWKGDLTGSENPKEITIDKAKTVTAVFVKKQYPLTIEIEGEGTVTEEVIKQGLATDYNSGTIVELTAVPSGNWEFVEWSGDITSTENPVQITIDGSKTVKVKFEKMFVPRIPDYGNVNLSTSIISNNYFHPGELLTAEEIRNKIDIQQNCDCDGCACAVKFDLLNNSYRYFDFNNDNKPDLFGWMINNSYGYAVDWGKYVVINDVLGDFDVKYYDAETWFAGRIEINDFNGDGRDDALVFASDDHGDLNGGFYTDRTPLKIFYFNDDGTFKMDRIGPDTSSHTVTTSDFDNDGDVDIINYEWWMNDGSPNHPEVPLFYINDGNGNFTVTDSNFLESKFYKEEGLDYTFTGLASFDLNKDGYIDLISGYTSNFEAGLCEWDYQKGENVCYSLDYAQDIRVLWGNSEGTFSESNSTRIDLPLNSWGNDKVAYEFGFIDYDNDGDFDIINVGAEADPAEPNSGGYIELFRNNGDQTFSRVTESIFDVYDWDFETCCVNKDDIPLFYDIVVLDKDNDGDFDILPYSINFGALGYDDSKNEYFWYNNIGKDFYWENIGGSFKLNHDKNDYKN